MKRIRLLGLALVAVFAMSAVAASGASAFTTFEAETYPVKIKGTQTNTQEFAVNSGSIQCKKATFEGSASGASATLKVKPKYEECTFAALGAATVEMNGCEYNLHAAGTVDVECETGKKIVVKAATCEVKVGSQSGLGGISYLIKGSGKTREVEVSSEVKTIAYEESSGLGCLTPGAHTNGVYKGKVLGKGTNGEGVQEGIFLK